MKPFGGFLGRALRAAAFAGALAVPGLAADERFVLLDPASVYRVSQ